MARPTRIDVAAFTGLSDYTQYAGGGVKYVVESITGALYYFIMDTSNDPAYIKSIDGGMSWAAPIALKACSQTSISVWYQRWTDPTGALGDKILCAYADSASDDVFFRTIDTANGDALGTEYTIFAGASTANGGALSIAQMRGGNILCVGSIDAGVEMFTRKSTDSGATWADAAAGYEANADLCICLPGWGADTQDAMMFYYDRDATEVSVKYYDDSANSWSEASLATSISLPNHTSTTLGHISATVDHANSQNLCAFWTAVDVANADLRVFKCTQSAQSETASNVILNSTDDQGFCAISIFGSSWYVFYGGKTGGSETYNTAMCDYYKISTNGGTTWGSETLLNSVQVSGSLSMAGIPICYKTFGLMNVVPGAPYGYRYNAPLTFPRATFQLGL